MKNGEIEKLRNKLGLDRHEFGQFLGLEYRSLMNIENGVRNPTRLTMKLLRYLNSISKKEALDFIEDLNRHEPK
ncbi:MAG: helix-turn-helix transcriptional regulator [Bdellovibrionaceae bacterium]|nr:helix-turn-helix transcriptional regulator [Pseudobdellovibrionaceae bacterium]